MFQTRFIPFFTHRTTGHESGGLGRRLTRLVAFACLLSAALPLSAANIIHEFYVPMPEVQERAAFVSIEPASGIVGQTLESVVSIVATGAGSIIHYDEWEDGYEVDLNNPAQSSTKIWGDGNNANGIPPGYVNDPAGLASGAVINLRNLVSLPRNPATLLYDGRDRFGGTKALVVTRTGWAVAPGSVLAGSVEVMATMDYGTQYVSPVGQDVSSSSMFEYVGLMVMARENGTSVTVDVNGPVSGGATTFTLNQGESYLVNGGVLKGATVTATKPVQVQLITGDIGARYETDWFTLYPVADWTGTYYTPVGTAADGDATLGFFYNPHASAITVNVLSNLGTGSFNVPAYGVTQYQMPQNSGARFTSAGEETFFGLVMVGANPSANNVHDWGFTLVPSDSLTTEAVVGWGPGSSDLSQNGSPVWVTPVAATRVYVDYNGDRNGPLTDPRGNKYDVHYDMTALEVRRVSDPDKDQSAMRVYTLDGAQIAAAWGQDPATAGPGNPFLDVGTTVLPFPVPTLKKSFALTTDTAPSGLSIGDTIEYRIEVDNKGLLPLGNLLVLDPLNPSLTYVAGSTARDGTTIPDGSSGTLFPLDEGGYVVPIIMRGGSTFFTYRCVINAAGSIANTASNSNYNLISTTSVVVPPPAGSTPCGVQFTNSSGTVQSAYSAGALVYGTLTDPDANNNITVAESITIVVMNTSNGDTEFVTLIETGVNTGVFRNTTGLPTSTTSGTNQMDGTLLVTPGNSLSFTYTDPEFSETCTGSAVIAVPTQNKYLYLSDPAQALDRIDPVATADGTTASTATLGVGTATIAVVGAAASSNSSQTASSHSFSYNSGSTGSNRILMVGIEYRNNNSQLVSSVTYNGVAMTSVGTAQIAASTPDGRIYIYRLLNPATGANTLQVNWSAALTQGSVIGAVTYEGVDQTTPTGTFASLTSAGSTTPNVTVTSGIGQLVFGLCGGRTTTDYAVTNGGSSLWTSRPYSGQTAGSGQSKAGVSPSVSLTWSGSNAEWVAGGVSLNPATGGGTPTTTFIQTPTFASTFTMPVGSAPTVTAHYTVVTGTMLASPTITARLKKGASTLATSTGTTASAATGAGVFTFTFASLGSAINFAATEALTLEITTAQSGITFTIDYDSATKPSKITLPTTTVINVDSLGVYDAPYPGGSLITAPASGSTVYIRSTASDPFGAYDITSMGLIIDGPGLSGDVSTTLNAGQVVATGTGTKTYEYAWTVGATEGAYDIVVTGNEGSEGIQATRATSVNVTFLDLGTPSVTEFTTGSNGPHTTTYAGNEEVFVRIIDLDQNLDAGVAETITAVITSLAGDSELVTLTETGVNTGIFVVGIPASTTAPNTFNNGTLHAVLGDVLTVNYVDPTDSTDTGTDTATIPNIAPAISVNKTLVMPTDGQAVVGEALQYTVQVTNTGNTTLSTVALTDLFPALDLTFISASITPDTIGSGSLIWTNVGPLTSGQSTTITLNFTALSTAAPATNTAMADAGGGVTGGDSADVTITNPAITISKTLLSPNPGPANIGDNVTFRITLQNTGDTAIATLPLEDTFSGADFEFVSATVTPDATGSGSLLWLDVTGSGTLAVAASTTIDVTLQAKGAADPAINTAAANYTVDVNGDDVPPVSSSASITLTAAKISGHVYDDVDQSVTFNVGDAALQSITVSLYTDPNGDGNPADGVLVSISSTDVAGAYEFLNLPAGNYVIVESQPPGYSSSGDTAGANDNRIPVVVSTFTTYAGNDFFDYLTPPVSYSSITGTVWNDADASATINGGEIGLENVPVDLVEDTNGNGIADPGEPVVSSTLTAADGSYSFTGLNAGNYVVVEHDLFGWYSTADVSAPNNNMIPVALAAATDVTGRDFLDVLTGTTGGKVFHDVNGNGSFDVGTDSPLPNIDVIITDSFGVDQTVVTNASGDWTATVPPGSTSINVDQTDPQFTAVFITGYTQTAGTDPNTITAVSSVNTPAGDDGFRLVATVTGHVYLDTNGNGTQDSGEPDLANVDVVITDVDNVTQTVVTNASGNWTATVPPGLTSANINNADPQFTALVLAGNVQTQGTDPNSFTAVANTSTDGGIDGYFNPGTISGSVLADTNNDNTGDLPIAGVLLTLLDAAGDPFDGDPGTIGVQTVTTTTDITGAYSFTDLPPGTYGVRETQPGTYLSVSDSDGGDLNEVRPIIVTGGSTSTANFVEEAPGTISGTVAIGASPLPDVVLTLFTDPNGDGDPTDGVQSGSTVLTNVSGVYTFTNVAPGNYVVVQTQPSGYVSVNDGDTTTPGDDVANASPTDNRIPVTITAGEADDGNNFIEGCPTITVNPTTLPDGVVGTIYSQALSATNGTAPYSYAVTSGTLPADLSLVSNVITGTPTSTVSHTFTITVTDALGCEGARVYTVAPICPVITVDPASLPNGVVGTAYSQTLSAMDGTAPYTFAVTTGTLPAGLNLASGVISGTPTSTTATSFTITATDTHGCAGTRAFTVTPTCPIITVNPTTLPNGVVGTPYSQTLSASDGTAPYTFAVTVGTLPTGLNLTAGVISGTPTSTTASSFTITATDTHGCTGSRAFTVTPTCPVITVDPTTLPAAVVGTPYSQTLSASDGTAPYTFAVTTGTLPAGLTLTAGVISGTPTSTAVAGFTITATDTHGCTGTRVFTLTPTCPAITVNPATLPDASVGVPYSQTITATGGTAHYTFTVTTGSLPTGLTLTAGVISGTPTASGTMNFTITATDDYGCEGTRSTSITALTTSISGSVFADTDNDDDGDTALIGAQVALFTDPNGDGDPADGVQVGAPVTVNGSGVYTFSDVVPDDYVIVLLPSVGYLPVADGDLTTGADDAANASTTDRRIPVSLAAGETDDGNDFVEEQSGSIGNLVWHDANNDGLNNNGEVGIDSVLVELLDTLNAVVSSTTTAGGGLYSFANVAPGSYRLRIATAPALYPLSSTTTDASDNSDDNDDNGIQATPTAATISPIITVSAAQVKNTIDFGFTALAGARRISGEVRDDYDLDSNFSDLDQPVPSVTVRLYADSNGNGTFDSGTDTLIGSTTTNILGQYSFTGLPDGIFFVQEVDPAGASSTGDTQGSNDNLISVTLAGSDSTGNDFLDAVDPAGYIYSPVDGSIIAGGSISVSGPGVVTILMDGSTGQYSFVTDGTAGIYTLSYTPPVGYQIDPTRPVAGMNFDPTGLPSPHALGSAEDPLNAGHLSSFTSSANPYYLTFDLSSGDPLVINNNIPLVQIKPTTFTGWQYANQLGGQNGPTQDPDGDGVTNLEEFAFCFNPSSGINGGCSLEIVRNGDGSIDALMRRVIGATGITYHLEYIADLTSSGASGAGWTDVTTINPSVTSNGDGTETARYLNLATIPALSGGRGFVRIKVTLISDGTIVRGDTSGWATRSIATACQSCSQPFLKCEIFTGSVDGVIGSVLSVINSVGSGDLAAQFTAGRHYYVEVISGDHEGHRFEINEAASTPNGIAIDTASARNTLGSSLPATLAGDQVVVREHYRINELFDPTSFTSTLDPSTADRLLFHNRNSSAFETFWLFTHPLSGTPRWVDVEDGALLDAGDRVLDVAEGIFVHPKGPGVTLVFSGKVRSNDMACPLLVGANLTGNGWPLDMSPVSRKMLVSDGFTGSQSSLAADRIQLWNADENASTQGYTGYFLLNAAAMQRWVGQADASVSSQDATTIFKMLRGQFIQPRTPRPNHLILNPWTP